MDSYDDYDGIQNHKEHLQWSGRQVEDGVCKVYDNWMVHTEVVVEAGVEEDAQVGVDAGVKENAKVGVEAEVEERGDIKTQVLVIFIYRRH